MKDCRKYWLLPLLVLPAIAYSSQGAAQEHDPITSVILWVGLIFTAAIAGRFVAKKWHQPSVLGELLMGIVLGNLCYWLGSQLMVVLREGASIFTITQNLLHGISLADAVKNSVPNPLYTTEVITALSSPNGIDYLKIVYALDMFSRFGVIFLLFMVGLESSVKELMHTGREALQVALIGVIAPILLGFGAAYLLIPSASYQVSLFVAATLCATSIGITARILSEMKKLRTREARTILGAAMIDDILGLIILSIVSSIVINGSINGLMLLQITASSILFFTVALLVVPKVLHRLIRAFSFLEMWQAKLFVSFVLVMSLAWLAAMVQLGSIIGAFVAGMIINDDFFKEETASRLNIKDLISPLEFLLAPLFFMLIGMQVKLESFLDWQVLLIASGLILAAIVGKLVSGLGASRKDDRLLIGMGMLPRGEVGLVFASIGRTLGIMSDQLFSAIILMVMVTTIMVPPLLKARFQKGKKL